MWSLSWRTTEEPSSQAERLAEAVSQAGQSGELVAGRSGAFKNASDAAMIAHTQGWLVRRWFERLGSHSLAETCRERKSMTGAWPKSRRAARPGKAAFQASRSILILGHASIIWLC
jgi:hypothetical protein